MRDYVRSNVTTYVLQNAREKNTADRVPDEMPEIIADHS